MTTTDARGDVVVTLEREFSIVPQLMWELWTDPAHLARWFRPTLDHHLESDVTADVRVGGAWKAAMHGVDGGAWTVGGRFLEVSPITRLALSWAWEPADVEASAPSGESSRVEVTLTPTRTGTHLRLDHSLLTTQEDRDSHLEGWVGCFASLSGVYEEP